MCELDIVKSHHFFEQPHHLILTEVNCTSLKERLKSGPNCTEISL